MKTEPVSIKVLSLCYYFLDVYWTVLHLDNCRIKSN